MSTQSSATSAADAASGAPDNEQALQEEIERTRQHLGETVDALAAKADVKARAQDKASQVKAQAQDKAGQVKAQAQEKASLLTRRLKIKAAQARLRAGVVAASARQRAAGTTASVAKVTPEPVKQAAGNAVASTRRHRGPVAAAVGASVLAWLLIRRWRQR
jgi:Protein of unknown function (DUF3618)